MHSVILSHSYTFIHSLIQICPPTHILFLSHSLIQAFLLYHAYLHIHLLTKSLSLADSISFSLSLCGPNMTSSFVYGYPPSDYEHSQQLRVLIYLLSVVQSVNSNKITIKLPKSKSKRHFKTGHSSLARGW